MGFNNLSLYYSLFLVLSLYFFTGCARSEDPTNETLFVAYTDKKNQTQLIETTFEQVNSDLIVFGDIIVGHSDLTGAGDIVHLNNIENQAPSFMRTNDLDPFSVKPTDSAIWPGGILPYKIGKTFIGAPLKWINEQIHLFNQTMQENLLNIRLVPKTDEEAYAIFTYFPKSAGAKSCGSSWVGYRGKPSNINISCLRTRTFQHEVLHLLGIAHEHQRPDRDQYVIVDTHENNLNYKKYPILQAYLPGKYDLDSVMHYQFNKEMKLRPGVKDTGDRTSLSQGDLEGLAAIYGSVFPGEEYSSPSP